MSESELIVSLPNEDELIQWRTWALLVLEVYAPQNCKQDFLNSLDTLSLLCLILEYNSVTLRQIIAVLLTHIPPTFYSLYLNPELSQSDSIYARKLRNIHILLEKIFSFDVYQLDFGSIISAWNDKRRSNEVRLNAFNVLSKLFNIIPLPFLQRVMGNNKNEMENFLNLAVESASRDVFPCDDLQRRRVMEITRDHCPHIIEVYGHLLPTSNLQGFIPLLVQTETTKLNLERLSSAVMTELPILVMGKTGCGKSVLIRELAAAMGQLDHLVDVFVDPQTDAKALIGAYICSDIPGEFSWRAGVVTQAVLHGHWLIFEDIDRASIDLLAALTTLIEHR